MYIASSKTDRTSWNNAPSTVPYNPQVYCWAEIFRTLAYNGYYNKSITLNNITSSGGGAGEDIDIGQTDRVIDFRIGGGLGFRMEGLAATGIDYVALKPIPLGNNSRIDKTDLGTEAYPFRKLYLNDGVYVNGVKLEGGSGGLYEHHLTLSGALVGNIIAYSKNPTAFTNLYDMSNNSVYIKNENAPLFNSQIMNNYSVIGVLYYAGANEREFIVCDASSSIERINFNDVILESDNVL
jgi:hypothetical protein